MSPEAQRIAIAEVCGYRYGESKPFWMATPVGQPFVACSVDKLPDYLNDLNALREAEKVLKSYQAEEYVIQLASILLNEASRDLLTYEQTANWYNVFVLLNATAAQRAEAFLRTLGKWVPGE